MQSKKEEQKKKDSSWMYTSSQQYNVKLHCGVLAEIKWKNAIKKKRQRKKKDSNWMNS